MQYLLVISIGNLEVKLLALARAKSEVPINRFII